MAEEAIHDAEFERVPDDEGGGSTSLVPAAPKSDPAAALAPKPDLTITDLRLAAEAACASMVLKNKLGGVTQEERCAGAFLLMMTARDLGLPPAASLHSMHIINGAVTLGAHLILALVMKSGKVRVGYEEGDGYASVTMTRIDGLIEPYTATWTMERAKKAGLVKDGGGWAKHPTAMLRKCAMVEAARAVVPDVIFGIYIPEEMGDGFDSPMAPNQFETAGAARGGASQGGEGQVRGLSRPTGSPSATAPTAAPATAPKAETNAQRMQRQGEAARQKALSERMAAIGMPQQQLAGHLKKTTTFEQPYMSGWPAGEHLVEAERYVAEKEAEKSGAAFAPDGAPLTDEAKAVAAAAAANKPTGNATGEGPVCPVCKGSGLTSDGVGTCGSCNGQGWQDPFGKEGDDE